VIQKFAEKNLDIYKGTAMQSSILNRVILYLIIISQIVISSCKTQTHVNIIRLKKIQLKDIDGRVFDVLSNHNNIVLLNTVGGISDLIFIDRKNSNKKITIDLVEKGIKNPNFIKLNADNSIFLLRKLKKKDNETTHGELVKIDISGKIVFRTNIPFIPQGMFGADSLIYILGKYNCKVLHVFDYNGKYKKSFLNLNKLNLPKITWQLEIKKYDGKIYISSAENFMIWIINNSKLISKIKFRDDNNLIEKKRFGKKTKIYRIKGINDFIVYNNLIYVSCFAHSRQGTKYWYDVIDLNTGKLIKTIKTKNIYYFAEFNESIFVWHNFPEFELFKVTF